jgi:hypothetical protein
MERSFDNKGVNFHLLACPDRPIECEMDGTTERLSALPSLVILQAATQRFQRRSNIANFVASNE